MIRLSLSTMFFHEYTLPEIFFFCHDTGLDTIEFWFETPGFWLKGMPFHDLAECLDAYPFFSPITCHMPVLDLNPCSINPRVAEATVRYATECFEIAEKAGACVYTLHPGRRTAKRPPSTADFERFDRFIDSMHRVSDGSAVRVAMENMEPKVNALMSRPGEIRELLDREPWLAFTLDVSHAMSISVEEALLYVDLCGDRLVNVHLSVPGPAGSNHCLPSTSPEIFPFIRYIVDRGYSGVMTLEIEDRNFPGQFTSREKIEVIRRECSFIRDILART
jgi:sugar phosphate isomerase/epimerase